MTSKLSKLIISSHFAAADYPNAESIEKCFQQADGVLLAAHSYVQAAEQQRGKEIPRLFPGFVIGSTVGGNWRSNGLDPHDPITPLLSHDEGAIEPLAMLDGKLVERLTSSLRKLEKNLAAPERVITPFQHEVIGDNVCQAGQEVLGSFKPLMAAIESIDLSSLGNVSQAPQLVDFGTTKQSLYDNVSDLIMSCQDVTGPLADEWSEVKGQDVESRLDDVRRCARALDASLSRMNSFLQVLYRLHPQKMKTMPDRPSAQTCQSFTDGNPTSGNPRYGDWSGQESSPGPGLPTMTDAPGFLKLDLEHDVLWDARRSPPAVKAGTLAALVEQLTRHDKTDPNFNNTFLLNYQSFTTAQELFALLVQRFQIERPEGLGQQDVEVWQNLKQTPIRRHVVSTLTNWFESFWMEDYNDDSEKLIGDVLTFVRDDVESAGIPGSARLIAVLDKRLARKDAEARYIMIQTRDTNAPTPNIPSNLEGFKFLDIDPVEYARQLTLIEFGLYSKLKATECLDKTWKKASTDQPDPAANIKALIRFSNQVTNWVVELILAQKKINDQAATIKHFVAVADVS
jgi:son of sevenless-like protein